MDLTVHSNQLKRWPFSTRHSPADFEVPAVLIVSVVVIVVVVVVVILVVVLSLSSSLLVAAITKLFSVSVLMTVSVGRGRFIANLFGKWMFSSMHTNECHVETYHLGVREKQPNEHICMDKKEKPSGQADEHGR